MEEGGEDDAAINPFADLDETLVARGPLVELDEDDDANFQVGAGAAADAWTRSRTGTASVMGRGPEAASRPGSPLPACFPATPPPMALHRPRPCRSASWS
jgi:hypothetical protein